MSPLLATLVTVAPAVAAQNAGVLAVVGASGAVLYDGPDGQQLETLAPGSVLTASARTAGGAWIQVTEEGGATGWVKASEIVAFGLDRCQWKALALLPPATIAPAAATTAPAATAAPTATATQAPPTATPLPSPTPPPSPTPLPSPTTAPTVAPTVSRTASTAASAAASTAGLIAVVAAAGADLYAAPDGEIVDSLPIAEPLTVSGRDEAGDWAYVTTGDGETGWVKAASIVVFGLDKLPVVAANAEEASAGLRQPPPRPLRRR